MFYFFVNSYMDILARFHWKHAHKLLVLNHRYALLSPCFLTHKGASPWLTALKGRRDRPNGSVRRVGTSTTPLWATPTTEYPPTPPSKASRIHGNAPSAMPPRMHSTFSSCLPDLQALNLLIRVVL